MKYRRGVIKLVYNGFMEATNSKNNGEKIFNKQQTKYFIKLFTNDFIAKYLAKNKNLVVVFEGELGAGKTQIIKWIAKNLGIKEIIQSPTFALWKGYKFKIKNKEFFMNHIDLYRLNNPKDIFKLGLRKNLKEPNNVFFIEWGEKIKKFLSAPFVGFKISIEKNNKRKIIING